MKSLLTLTLVIIEVVRGSTINKKIIEQAHYRNQVKSGSGSTSWARIDQGRSTRTEDTLGRMMQLQ